MSAVFDTHTLVKRLIGSGFTEQQAETLSGALQEVQIVQFQDLASKRDLKDQETALRQNIEEVKRDIKELEVGLKQDMKKLEVSLKRDMKDLETRLTVEVEKVRKEIDVKLSDLKADLLKWTFGMLLAQIAIVAALVKLL
jgi:predicted  nucleic acid-binding Zn-ribbon protein